MATLKIYDPTIKPKAAADTDLSGITLPLTIAQQEGKAVSSVGQAFANIVNHLGETEDRKQSTMSLCQKLLKRLIEE